MEWFFIRSNMNSSCPFTWRMEWLCSSKWTSGGVQCVKLRSGLGEHNINKGRSCVRNDTRNLSSVPDMKLKLFQDMNTVILILLTHLLVKHTVQILECWNSDFFFLIVVKSGKMFVPVFKWKIIGPLVCDFESYWIILITCNPIMLISLQ